MLDKFFNKSTFPQELEVAEGVRDLIDSRDEIEAILPQLMEWSKEAAMMGDDNYSTQLLEEYEHLEDTIGDLKAIELQIKTTYLKANGFRNMTNVTSSLKKCKSLFSAGSDFARFGKDLAEFKRNLASGSQAVKSLRRELAPQGTLFSAKQKKNDDTPRLAELKAQRDMLIAQESATEQKEATASIDISSIMDDENSRG